MRMMIILIKTRILDSRQNKQAISNMTAMGKMTANTYVT